jgi:hypothetical protein
MASPCQEALPWTWQDNGSQRMLKTKSCGRLLAMDCFTQCFRHAALSIERHLNCWVRDNPYAKAQNTSNGGIMPWTYAPHATLGTIGQAAPLRPLYNRECIGHILCHGVRALSTRRMRKHAATPRYAVAAAHSGLPWASLFVMLSSCVVGGKCHHVARTSNPNSE